MDQLSFGLVVMVVVQLLAKFLLTEVLSLLGIFYVALILTSTMMVLR